MLVGSDHPSTRIPYKFVQLLFVFSGSHCAPSEKQILVSKGKRTFDSKDQKFFLFYFCGSITGNMDYLGFVMMIFY